jgi:GT2 family glycosyltransferase
MTCVIVVVSYGGGELVAECLRAVADFAPNARAIVINNDPGDLAAEQAASSVGAKLIHSAHNVGFAAAVNRAIANSDSDLVVLLNPDVDRVDGNLADVEVIFDRDPHTLAVGVRLINSDGTLQHSCLRAPGAFDFVSETLGLANRFPRWRRPRRFRMLDWCHDTERVVDAASGALLILRRAAIQDLGLLDERFFVYSEELDLLVRAKARGWKTYFTPAVTAVHRGGGSTAAGSTYLSLLLLESWYAYARKHFRSWQIGALRVALLGIDIARLPRALIRGRKATTSVATLGARIRLHFGLGLRHDAAVSLLDNVAHRISRRATL